MSKYTDPPELVRLQDEAIRVQLLSCEDAEAKRVGEGRTLQNLGVKDRLAYDQSRLMPNYAHANIHAVVAEIGVARVLGVNDFHATLWERCDHEQNKDLPDIQWNDQHVEVKWRRSGYKMPVDRKDAERNVLVIWAECHLASSFNCVCDFCTKYPNPVDLSKVRVLGGGHATSLWRLGKPYKEGDESRVGVYVRHLTDIKSILDDYEFSQVGE